MESSSSGRFGWRICPSLLGRTWGLCRQEVSITWILVLPGLWFHLHLLPHPLTVPPLRRSSRPLVLRVRVMERDRLLCFGETEIHAGR